METRSHGQQSGRLGLLVVLALALLLRLPFLNHAVQGDDIYYLAGAQHAQIEPLHPNHVQFVFLGKEVDMRGHSHPPFNAWFLALLLYAFGDVREPAFHMAYAGLSLIAAGSMWSIARRWSQRPLWASLLFLAAPAFVVNGNSFESDLPFLAMWMASVALFAAGRYGLAVAPLACAGLAAYQAIFLIPILWLYLWLFDRRRRAGWAIALTPGIAIAAVNLFERATTGAAPAGVLAGYFQTYGFQALTAKLRNAAMLLIHSQWIVAPPLLPAALWISRRRRDSETLFLTGWIALFFAGALAVFFSGSARYLLPIAAPIALLASRLPVRWLAPAFVVQLALALALAWSNAQHWEGYRQFAREIRGATANKRVWANTDWGLRFYLEADGALPLLAGQSVYPGEVVVTSELAMPSHFLAAGGALAPLAAREIRPALPFRLVGLGSRSGYSSAAAGFLPFDLSFGPVDRVRAEIVVERKPELSWVPLGAPEAATQIVAGFHAAEGAWRWMAGRATVLVKAPPGPRPLRVEFAIPGPSPTRELAIAADGREVARMRYPGPGVYKLESPPVATGGSSATITLTADKSFTVPGDQRELSIIVSSIGFAP